MSFIPLHVYSGYSFLKSGLKIGDYLKTAKKLGYTTVGISDFQNLTGAPSLFHEAEKEGIKVILGEDLFIDNLLFSFYVLNEQGYHNLLKLSLAVENGEASSSKIAELNEGLAIVLTTKNDPLKESMLKGMDDFGRRLAKLTRGFSNFYIGLDSNDSKDYLDSMREFAFTHGYKVIAFPSIKYIKKDDAIVLEMMRAIDSKEVLEIKKLEGEEYLKSPEEILKDYSKEEIENYKAKLTTDFKNEKKPEIEKIPFDFSKEGYSLVITNTGKSHADLSEEYSSIPLEMKSVAAFFGKSVLREISEEDILNNLEKIRLSCGDRAVMRAFHFFEENKRVEKEVECLKQNDFAGFLQLVKDVRAKFVLISFNSEGFIQKDEMVELMQQCGKVQVLEAQYNAFRGSRNQRILNLREID